LDERDDRDGEVEAIGDGKAMCGGSGRTAVVRWWWRECLCFLFDEERERECFDEMEASGELVNVFGFPNTLKPIQNE